MTRTSKIVLAVIIITFAISGGICGAYFWSLSEMTKYENSIYGFSLQFPAGWGEIKETIVDDQIWKSVRLTAENDDERYIEIHAVLAKDKDNWVVKDFPHSLLGYNSTYRFYYVGSADDAGRPWMEDQKFFDIQNETKKISRTFKGESPVQPSTSADYQNTQYGFIFALPISWKGHSIIIDKWEGYPINVKNAVKIEGPKIIIRHPQWTTADPRQDIPIMIFTIEQWNSVEQMKLSVSAAPIMPMELGRNVKYVFALPARYNYAFPAGFEEVEEILKNNPLRAL